MTGAKISTRANLKLSVEQLKDLISHAKAHGVVKLCYDGVEIIIDNVVLDESRSQLSDDNLLYYSSN